MTVAVVVMETMAMATVAWFWPQLGNSGNGNSGNGIGGNCGKSLNS